MSNPFQIAEEYIQLRKQLSPKHWVDVIMRINEMILTPLISIFLFVLRQSDTLTFAMSMISVFRAWRQWMLFTQRRFDMQNMILQTMASGGPQIRTNDPDYLPYVYADAVVRLSARRQGFSQDHPHWKDRAHN